MRPPFATAATICSIAFASRRSTSRYCEKSKDGFLTSTATTSAPSERTIFAVASPMPE